MNDICVNLIYRLKLLITISNRMAYLNYDRKLDILRISFGKTL